RDPRFESWRPSHSDVTDSQTAAVIMAAGLGTRMRSALPKHLHPLLGRRVVDWVLAAAAESGASRIVVVDAAAPLLTGDYLRALVDEHERAGAQVTLLSFEPDFPLPYGRVIR